MKKKEKKSTKENTRKGVPKTYYRKILKEVVDQSEKFGTNTSCVEQGRADVLLLHVSKVV